MVPNRKSRGRPSKGPRRAIGFSVSTDLNHALVAQAKAEGIYKDALIVDIIATHFPNWSARPRLTQPVLRVLSDKSAEKAIVRLPKVLGDAVHAQGEAQGLPASRIVAEILATHLPERIERFRPSDAPQQEELTLTSS